MVLAGKIFLAPAQSRNAAFNHRFDFLFAVANARQNLARGMAILLCRCNRSSSCFNGAHRVVVNLRDAVTARVVRVS